MITKRVLWATSGWTLLSLVLLSSAQAAEVKGNGSVTYVPVASESSQLPNGSTVQRTHLKGIVLADDASVPLHLASQDCSGTTVVAADGSPPVANGYCDGLDQDGDVWWLWWHNGSDGNTWGFIGGTGKFAGIEGGGTTTLEVEWPDGRFTILWEGTWQMQ